MSVNNVLHSNVNYNKFSKLKFREVFMCWGHEGSSYAIGVEFMAIEVENFKVMGSENRGHEGSFYVLGVEFMAIEVENFKVMGSENKAMVGKDRLLREGIL
jgi:formylmethanofuran dehydrogenase subunit E